MAAIKNTVWYVNAGNMSSTGYYVVPVWATSHAYTVGTLVRPLTAPATGNFRIYVCTTAGTSVTEPTWTFTKGALQNGTAEVFQECTGQPAVNGDATNNPVWSAGNTVALGQIIQNTQGTGCFIATSISGSGTTAGSQPAGLTTPVLGNTTTDNSGANQVVWTCINASSNAFTSWASAGAPLQRLADAFTANWGAAGDTFYVNSAHAYTQSTTFTTTVIGTAAAPIKVLCVGTTHVPPQSSDLTTGASEATSASGAMNFGNNAGYMYGQGINWICGSGATNPNMTITPAFFRADNCTFTNGGTSGGLTIFGTVNAINYYELNNPTFSMAAAGNSIVPKTNMRIRGGSLTGTVPTSFLTNSVTASAGLVEFYGFNFNAAGTWTAKNLMAANGIPLRVYITNCEVGAALTSGTVVSTPTAPGPRVFFMASDTSSGTTTARQELYDYYGTLTTDTGVIVTTGGSTDGTTPISWKVVTTSNTAGYFGAFRTFPLAELNVVNGSFKNAATITATVQIASATAGLTIQDVWLEAEWVNQTYPLSAFGTSGAADVLSTTLTGLSAGVTWTSSPGNTYTLSYTTGSNVTLNGILRFVVKVAKAGLTVYIDPKVTLA